MLEQFFDSLPAIVYRKGLEDMDIQDTSKPSMQCIGKIIGRDLT